MSGDVHVQNQALTDIAGTDVGGGALLCQLANSQDESLVQFYSEVLTFVFFVAPGQMLPVPWTLLGARRYVSDLCGESSKEPGPNQNKCGAIRATDWLNQGISQASVQVLLENQYVNVAASAFVAVASKSSAALAGRQCPLYMAVNNNCNTQRHHFEAYVSLWYQAYEPTMYPSAVQGAFKSVIRRAGTGPWGAGVWYGDSQQYFLTVWLATSLLGGVGLDYYIYDHFCENPGNQCFVLGAQGCATCIAQSGARGVNAKRCGTASYNEMKSRFAGQPGKVLYFALKDLAGPPTQVFDAVAKWMPTQAELSQDVAPSWHAPSPEASSASPSYTRPSPAPASGTLGPGPSPVPTPYQTGGTMPMAGPSPVWQQPAMPSYQSEMEGQRCLEIFKRYVCLPQFRLPQCPR
jgi:hypothetical protein